MNDLVDLEHMNASLKARYATGEYVPHVEPLPRHSSEWTLVTMPWGSMYELRCSPVAGSWQWTVHLVNSATRTTGLGLGRTDTKEAGELAALAWVLHRKAALAATAEGRVA